MKTLTVSAVFAGMLAGCATTSGPSGPGLQTTSSGHAGSGSWVVDDAVRNIKAARNDQDRQLAWSSCRSIAMTEQQDQLSKRADAQTTAVDLATQISDQAGAEIPYVGSLAGALSGTAANQAQRASRARGHRLLIACDNAYFRG
jgi:hypothetical protein